MAVGYNEILLLVYYYKYDGKWHIHDIRECDELPAILVTADEALANDETSTHRHRMRGLCAHSIIKQNKESWEAMKVWATDDKPPWGLGEHFLSINNLI